MGEILAEGYRGFAESPGLMSVYSSVFVGSKEIERYTNRKGCCDCFVPTMWALGRFLDTTRQSILSFSKSIVLFPFNFVRIVLTKGICKAGIMGITHKFGEIIGNGIAILVSLIGLFHLKTAASLALKIAFWGYKKHLDHRGNKQTEIQQPILRDLFENKLVPLVKFSKNIELSKEHKHLYQDVIAFDEERSQKSFLVVALEANRLGFYGEKVHFNTKTLVQDLRDAQKIVDNRAV